MKVFTEARILLSIFGVHWGSSIPIYDGIYLPGESFRLLAVAHQQLIGDTAKTEQKTKDRNLFFDMDKYGFLLLLNKNFHSYLMYDDMMNINS